MGGCLQILTGTLESVFTQQMLHIHQRDTGYFISILIYNSWSVYKFNFNVCGDGG